MSTISLTTSSIVIGTNLFSSRIRSLGGAGSISKLNMSSFIKDVMFS